MSRYEYNKGYVKKHLGEKYDELKVRVPKGQKAAIEAHARAKVQSLTGYINGLIRADMGLTEAQWKQGE